MVEPSLPLKALLVGDASLSGHHGSAIVTAQLVKLAGDAGIDVLHGWTWEAANSALQGDNARYDLVIVNGEGSVHSDSRAARRFAGLAKQLAAEQRAPAYLVNATVEGNSAELDYDLSFFRLRFVRDTSSQAYLARRDVAAEVVHDLTLTSSDLPRADGRGPLLVTDASDQETTRRLLAIARASQAEAVTLRSRPPWPARGNPSRRVSFEIKRQLARFSKQSPRSLRYGDALSRDAFVDRLAHEASGILCGRYHAVCLALRMGLPFVAVAGNTGKTGALLADIGLDNRTTTLDDLELATGPIAIAPFSDGEESKLAAFLAAVALRAPAMFRDIASDARRWHAAPKTVA